MADDGAGALPERDEERRQFRPYRRFVRTLFAASVILGLGFILRGIIRHLDRMPSVETYARPDRVDERALRACADDLTRLEADIRKRASQLFAAPPEAPAPSEEPWTDLETKRVEIVARCRLNEPSQDSATRELHGAAQHLADEVRQYGLLYSRHRHDVLGHARDARRKLNRAQNILRAR